MDVCNKRWQETLIYRIHCRRLRPRESALSTSRVRSLVK